MCTQPENRAPCPQQYQTGGQNTTPYYGFCPPTAIYVHAFPPMQFDRYSPIPLPINPFLRPIMSEMRDGARAVSAPRRFPGRASPATCWSGTGGKINNYLNIWRIAKSSRLPPAPAQDWSDAVVRVERCRGPGNKLSTWVPSFRGGCLLAAGSGNPHLEMVASGILLLQTTNKSIN